jgi:hypothetical protein
MMTTEPHTERDRRELLERWKLAHAEYRAEVALGWDRQKLFMTLNPVLTAGLAAAAPPAPELPIVLGFGLAACVALAGMLIVLRSHSRYRATRATLQRLEDLLGFEDLQTTGGQREARGLLRLELFRVVDVIAAVFLLFALLDIVLAVLAALTATPLT